MFREVPFDDIIPAKDHLKMNEENSDFHEKMMEAFTPIQACRDKNYEELEYLGDSVIGVLIAIEAFFDFDLLSE